MNYIARTRSLPAVVVLSATLLINYSAGQEVTAEQLLNEIRELRQIVVSQQRMIENLEARVEESVVSESRIKTEVTEELTRTFSGQQPEVGALSESWFNNVEMYGLLHGSIDVLDDGSYLSGNSSRIGFRGSNFLDDDLNAVWQVEIGINLDEGGSKTDFVMRDTFVGLDSASFGSILIGRMDSAFERLHRWTDLFDSRVGDSRNVLSTATGSHGFDNREDNSIKYISPEINGFTGMATYTMPEGKQSESTFAANLAYRHDDGLLLAGGVALNGNGLVAGGKNELGLRLVGSYSINQFTVNGILEYLDNLGGIAGVDRTSGGLGAAYRIDSKNILKGQFRHTTGMADDYESTGFSLGYDHMLSDRTGIYVVYGLILNESLATKGVAGAGHGETVTPDTGDNSRGISFGIVHGW